jgi:hypothetical protein
VNILIILYQLTNTNDIPSLILAAKSLNLPVFKDGFDIYRGRLRGSPKMINNLHLSVLANLSEIANVNTHDDVQQNILKAITLDLKAFFSDTPKYKKRYEDFVHKKKTEFEIQEIITRLGMNVTKNNKNTEMLMENCKFFDDIIEYLIIIGMGENNDNDSVNSNNSNNNIDFILRVKDKRRKNLDEVKKLVCSIVENSIVIIKNIMGGPDEVSDDFSTRVNYYYFKINTACKS